MGVKQSVRTPSSYGGLMRYFDETKSKIILKPEQVVIFAIAIMVIVGLFHIFL